MPTVRHSGKQLSRWFKQEAFGTGFLLSCAIYVWIYIYIYIYASVRLDRVAFVLPRNRASSRTPGAAPENNVQDDRCPARFLQSLSVTHGGACITPPTKVRGGNFPDAIIRLPLFVARVLDFHHKRQLHQCRVAQPQDEVRMTK